MPLFGWTSDGTQAGFHHKPSWFPASLPGSSPGSTAPGRLWTEPVILPDFFFFFFSLIRGKRSWEKYALALPGFFWLFRIWYFNNKDLAQPGTLVCYMGDPEQIFSLPEKLLGLSCPGSEIFLYHTELNFWAFSGDLPVPILSLPPYFLKCLIILQFLCTSNALQHCFLRWLLPGLFLAQRLHQPLWCLLGTHSCWNCGHEVVSWNFRNRDML